MQPSRADSACCLPLVLTAGERRALAKRRGVRVCSDTYLLWLPMSSQMEDWWTGRGRFKTRCKVKRHFRRIGWCLPHCGALSTGSIGTAFGQVRTWCPLLPESQQISFFSQNLWCQAGFTAKPLLLLLLTCYSQAPANLSGWSKHAEQCLLP